MNKSTTVSEGILKSALEIIFLVTGDEYVIVKKKSLHNNVHLLAGEVPVIYDDFAVFFSREEWKFVEGHKDYKDVVAENRKPSSPFGCAFASNSDRLNGKPSDAESWATRRKNETGGEQDDSEETPRGRIPAPGQEDEQIREMTETQTSAGGREAATECFKCKRVRRDSHTWECCQIHCHGLHGRLKRAGEAGRTECGKQSRMCLSCPTPCSEANEEETADDPSERRREGAPDNDPPDRSSSMAQGLNPRLRRFRKEWCTNLPWLKYDDTTGVAMCSVCATCPSIAENASKVVKGFAGPFKLETFKKHGKSRLHKKCLEELRSKEPASETSATPPAP